MLGQELKYNVFNSDSRCSDPLLALKLGAAAWEAQTRDTASAWQQPQTDALAIPSSITRLRHLPNAAVGRAPLASRIPFSRNGAPAMQENPESEPVRDQQQGHDESRNEIGGTQLSRHEPGVIGLVESIEEIGCTPDIEDPCYDNAGCTGQQYQRKQGEAAMASP
jgi:hypothetical protein